MKRSLRWLRGWFQSLAPSATREDFRAIALVFFVTTVALWVIAYGASAVITEGQVPRVLYPNYRTLNVWTRFDSVNYIDLARWGYEGEREVSPWFPLYPYLIRFLSTGWEHHYPVAHRISLVCFFLLLCVLFDITAQRHGKQIAHLSVLYISIFPSALFFRAVYPESLFTLLALLSYRAFAREHYLRCGIYGALAAMTRIPGIMLMVAFGTVLVWDIARGKKRFRPAMLFVGLIALGLGIVMAMQWNARGDPLQFLRAASAPGLDRSLSWPGVSIYGDLSRMFTRRDVREGWIGFHLVVDDIVAILAVVGAFYFFWRYGVLAGCFSLGLLLPPLMSGRTIGMIRYVLPVFLYQVFLAEIGNRRPWFHAFWVFTSALLLAFYTICFACWYWAA